MYQAAEMHDQLYMPAGASVLAAALLGASIGTVTICKRERKEQKLSNKQVLEITKSLLPILGKFLMAGPEEMAIL